MSIEFKTPGIHHIALRSIDLARSKQFYTQLLGFPLILEKENLFIFLAGSTAIAVRGPETATPKGDVFNPFRVGLDHLALACTAEAELEATRCGINGLRCPKHGSEAGYNAEQEICSLQGSGRDLLGALYEVRPR